MARGYPEPKQEVPVVSGAANRCAVCDKPLPDVSRTLCDACRALVS